MNKVAYTLITFLFIGTLSAQGLQEFPISEQWLAKITSLAPTAPRVKADVKKIMVFSQHTGFDHWTTPHNNEMLKILATKSGAFQITIAKDIASFDKRNLKQFDAVILNNSNPAGPKRDLFWDLLKKNSNLDDRRIAELAAQYERNLMDYVSKGGGL